ncbi:unnamed protein product, partial [marine sediment metagenome]
STTDPNLGDNHTYSLASGTGDTDNGSFAVTSGGSLQTAAAFDYETKSSYSIRVRTTDDGEGNMWYEETFTITVNDVNEQPTDIFLTNSTVSENSAPGTAVGNLSATDPDPGDSHTFSLVAGTGDGDNASFSIVGNELRTAEIFDFETKNSYSIRVETNDGNGGTYSKSFTITVNDVNEQPQFLLRQTPNWMCQSFYYMQGSVFPKGNNSLPDSEHGSDTYHNFRPAASRCHPAFL